MTIKEQSNPTLQATKLLTTGNEGLHDTIQTLNSIHAGEHDGSDVERQLRHVAHNLNCLRNLLIEQMCRPKKAISIPSEKRQ